MTTTLTPPDEATINNTMMTIPDGVDLPAPPEQAGFTKNQLMELILRDAGMAGIHDLTETDAIYILEMLTKVGASPDTVYILTETDMDLAHEVLDKIMPDDTVAEPGSAHDALNQVLLPAGRNFVHTFAEFLGDPRRDCALAVAAVDTTSAA